MIASVVRYFYFVALDGDYMNDWLTHLPAIIRPLIMSIGHLISLLLGF